MDNELAKGVALLETLKSTASNKAEFRQSVRDAIAQLKQLVSFVNDDLSSRLVKQAKALGRRSLFLGNTPTSRAAFAEILQKFTEARNNSEERVRIFVDKCENVTAIVERDVKDLEDELKRLEDEQNPLKDALASHPSSVDGDIGSGIPSEQPNKQ